MPVVSAKLKTARTVHDDGAQMRLQQRERVLRKVVCVREQGHRVDVAHRPRDERQPAFPPLLALVHLAFHRQDPARFNQIPQERSDFGALCANDLGLDSGVATGQRGELGGVVGRRAGVVA